MCRYEVLSHTGVSSCGHIYIKSIEKCDDAWKRPNNEPCEDPKQNRLPEKGICGRLKALFKPGYKALPGFCPQCLADGAPNIIVPRWSSFLY
ncbi:hypothetical protein N7462_003541 [Penicillium macrosclerotiorum]|uniref:uncharacterized protein n=1 Tax=Penicillium macrosclerotiorum TaxID=303699 RepID=UPI0025470E4E|nr:uncharacterized protein N7462_003541 [Penicillium macrosclerotiorum]KAJ5689149.1 hypothetical protein N7462_003541 [Penicillium macrosclerotiorum]